jgi:hypothetical protein
MSTASLGLAPEDLKCMHVYCSTTYFIFNVLINQLFAQFLSTSFPTLLVADKLSHAANHAANKQILKS